MVSLLDIIGPVMVGPSSSHTAGACRIGLLARGLVGGTPERARIELHGSFARTGEGHGTDKAIVGGLMGFRPDDERLRDALDIAEREGLDYQLRENHARRRRASEHGAHHRSSAAIAHGGDDRLVARRRSRARHRDRRLSRRGHRQLPHDRARRRGRDGLRRAHRRTILADAQPQHRRRCGSREKSAAATRSW